MQSPAIDTRSEQNWDDLELTELGPRLLKSKIKDFHLRFHVFTPRVTHGTHGYFKTVKSATTFISVWTTNENEQFAAKLANYAAGNRLYISLIPLRHASPLLLVRPGQPSIEYRGSGRIGTALAARVGSFLAYVSLTFAAKCSYVEYHKLNATIFFILTFHIIEYNAMEVDQMKMEIKVDVVSAILLMQIYNSST